MYMLSPYRVVTGTGVRRQPSRNRAENQPSSSHSSRIYVLYKVAFNMLPTPSSTATGYSLVQCLARAVVVVTFQDRAGKLLRGKNDWLLFAQVSPCQQKLRGKKSKNVPCVPHPTDSNSYNSINISPLKPGGGGYV